MSVDKDSPTWRFLKAAIEAELEGDRRNLEALVPSETTNILRGRISAYRTILALAEPKPDITASGRVY